MICFLVICSKRNRLTITERVDLRLKVTKLVPRIKTLCSKQQTQGSHYLELFYLELDKLVVDILKRDIEIFAFS